MTTSDNVAGASGEVAHEQMLTPAEAAQLKGVAKATVYKAVAEGALPHVRILGRIGLRKADVLAWAPSTLGGARNVEPMSEAAKEKLSRSQKARWAKRRET